MSSTSWVKMSEAQVTNRMAATCARFTAILSTVLYMSATSGFGTRSVLWPSMAGSPSLNLALHPSFFLKQSQPPPYSFLPLMIAGLPHSGQVRSPLRHAYLLSRVEHEPRPEPRRVPVGAWYSVQV